MAEFCLECFNEYVLPDGYRKRREKDVTLSREPELCEGCGKIKPVVILDRPAPFWDKWFRKKAL